MKSSTRFMALRAFIAFSLLVLLPNQPRADEAKGASETKGDASVSPSYESLADLFTEPFTLPEVRDELQERFGKVDVPEGVEELSDEEKLAKLDGKLVIAYGTYAKGKESEGDSPQELQDFLQLGDIHPLGTRSNYVRFVGHVSYNPSQPFTGFLHEKQKRSWILIFRKPPKVQGEDKAKEARAIEERNAALLRKVDELQERDANVFGELIRVKLGDTETDAILVDRLAAGDGLNSEVEICVVGRVIKRTSKVKSVVKGDPDRSVTRWYVQTTGRAYRIKLKGEY